VGELRDAVASAAAVRDGSRTVRGLVDDAIARAEAVDPVVHGFVVPTPEAARAAADALDQRIAARGVDDLPALAGVPSAVKDLSDVAGVPSRYGSRAVTGHVPTANGREVDQLLATGLVSLGKTATPEFGFVPTTEPLFGDPTRNPWNLDHSSGGSSGGAAAVVAAGVVPIAHATDGGGSIRIPAAINGLVGLKPTVDRHLRMAKMDHLPVPISVSSVVTRTVRDTAAFLAAAERHHRNTDLPAIGSVLGPAERRVRVGVVVNGPNVATAAPVVAAVGATADRLADLGHAVVDVDLPFDDRLGDDFILYWATLALLTRTTLGRSLPDHFVAADLDPFTAGLAEHARANLARIPLAVRRLRRTDRDYRAMFTDVDVLLTPVLAVTTPPLGEWRPDQSFDDLAPRLMDAVQFTPIQNITGAPAIAVPAGQHEGLPIGIQLAGLHGDERTLLELAYALEAVAPWPLVAPSVTVESAADPVE